MDEKWEVDKEGIKSTMLSTYNTSRARVAMCVRTYVRRYVLVLVLVLLVLIQVLVSTSRYVLVLQY